jgi:hypothetical protein
MTRRDGKEYFSVQINFPLKNGKLDLLIPESLITFDKTVKINGR